MAQPTLNYGEIYAGLEQVHGSRVSKTVGAYAPPREARALRCDRCYACSEDVANAEAGKGLAASVHK